METDRRPLEIDMLSAHDLPNINYLSKMDVYIVSSISSDRRSIERTPVDKKGGINPKWKNYKMKFYINELAAKQNEVILMFQIISRKIFGDRTIGFVQVPVKALLDEANLHENGGKKKMLASYQVSTLSGKTKGNLCFMYNFGEKFKVANQHEGYNYGTSIQEIQERSHLPMAYGFPNVGPMHPCEYSAKKSIGQNKKGSFFGLVFEWGAKFFEALLHPLRLIPQLKRL